MLAGGSGSCQAAINTLGAAQVIYFFGSGLASAGTRVRRWTKPERNLARSHGVHARTGRCTRCHLLRGRSYDVRHGLRPGQDDHGQRTSATSESRRAGRPGLATTSMWVVVRGYPQLVVWVLLHCPCLPQPCPSCYALSVAAETTANNALWNKTDRFLGGILPRCESPPPSQAISPQP